MKLRSSRSPAAISAALLLALVATVAPAARVAPARRPVYGGTLRIEIGPQIQSIDADAAVANQEEEAAKREIDGLIYEGRNADGSLKGVAGSGPFRISAWEPGKELTLAANDDFPGGRPFVDGVEITMGRSERDRVLDLELGRSDFSEISPGQERQAAARGVRVSVSQPDELIALALAPGRAATQDARVREAVARAIDRTAIVTFLLQREGEAAGGLLPQWASGTAFLFPTGADAARAKELRAQIGASPEIRLGYDADDALEESIAARVAVDAREAGTSVSSTALTAGGTNDAVDARLMRVPMFSADPATALGDSLALLGPAAGLDAAPAAKAATAEQIYQAQRAALDGFRVVPLVWIPRVYGLSERVHDWQAPATGEAWPLADVWLDAAAR